MLVACCSPKAPKVDSKTSKTCSQNRFQNEAKTNMWITRKSRNIMRMWGVETSTTMLLCGRRVHLRKSVSFKMIFESFQTNHKVEAKNNPETIRTSIEKTSRKYAETHRRNITQITQHFQMLAPIVEPVVWRFSGVVRFFIATWFSEPLGVPPWTDCWHPLGPMGPPWFDVLDLLVSFTRKLLQLSKIPEQQVAPNPP